MLHPVRRVRLGTFGGVFTPSILTILGVILFLRTGYVVGNGGLAQTLAIIVLANAISFFTVYSLVAIASNLPIKEGGPYYIISRTLGPVWGSIIGFVLFLAVSISVGFYCIGAAEVLAPFLPDMGGDTIRYTAALIALALFGIAWMGAELSTKFQYLVMTVLFVALFSFAVGALGRAEVSLFDAAWKPAQGSPGYWYLFAIFFPAITGFTQGVNMSGDLAHPSRSIIRGTVAAVGLSFAIYLAAALLLAAAFPQALLRQDMEAFVHAAWMPEAVTAGILAAAVSSALASFLGAPRVLAAMGRDGLFPLIGFFAVSQERPNPRKALLLSSVIVALTLWAGELNIVASVVTIFFLLTYGLLNYATFYEAHAQTPSFRPTVRGYSKWVSLAGVFVCVATIVAVDPVAGIVAAFVFSLLFLFLKYAIAEHAAWSDSTRSFQLKRIRDLLLQVNGKEEHPRDWHPNLLVLLPNRPQAREAMLYFASLVGSKSGTITAVRLFEKRLNAEDKAEQVRRIETAIASAHCDAFALVVSGMAFDKGLSMLVQSCGLGPIKTNTVLLGWPSRPRDAAQQKAYVAGVRAVLRQGINLIILKLDLPRWAGRLKTAETAGRIDIWWGEGRTSRLMLILAYLATHVGGWDNATIRILAQSRKDHEAITQHNFDTLLEEVRIDADVELLHDINPEKIIECSGDAALVFMPMKHFGRRPEDYVGDVLDDPRFDGLNLALFIAGEDIELDADPDETVTAADEDETTSTGAHA